MNMKNATILSLVLAVLASPALAQQPAPSPTPEPLAADFSVGEVSLGTQQYDVDKMGSQSFSSKFLEYRDIPQGGVLPWLYFKGKKGDFRWDISGRDVTQKDQVYFAKLETKSFRLTGGYTGIPHNFGFGGRSLLQAVEPNEWRLSDTVQTSYQNAYVSLPAGNQIDYNCQPRFGFTPAPTCFSLLGLVTPGLNAAPANVDLKILRGRTSLALDLMPGQGDFTLGVTYFHERRSGYRSANGTSFGFGNVVETPETVRYITQDVGVAGGWKGDWGNLKAAVRFNKFEDKYNEFVFDNPFRVTDSTDPNAYQAPGSGSRNGPAFGRMQLPPDNQAITEMVGATFKLGSRSRLSADVTLGQWKQDEDPLIPWTTNTAVLLPNGRPAATAPLFANTLGGKADTTAFNGFFHTSLSDSVGLNARYRRYKLDNKTPRYSMAGYTRFDAVWEDIPRITVPYGYSQDYFDANATFGSGVFGFEAGYRYTGFERQFRETDKTKENVVRGAFDLRSGAVTLRAIGEFGSRDYDEYDAVRSEDASFQSPGPPANQTVLRRYDQAKRDLRRVGAQVELSPGDGKFGLSAGYFHTTFEYDKDPVECEDVALFPDQSAFCPGGEQAALGLTEDKYDTFSVEANYAATDKVSLYAFYNWEDGDVLQDGRQSGATVNFDPRNVWTSNTTTKGNTFGAGADFSIVPEKWYAKLFYRYQKVDGNNDVSLRPGYSTAIYGANPTLQQCVGAAGPCAIPAFDDTKLSYLFGSLRYQFGKQWSAGVGVSYEDYSIKDSQTGNALNYMPASFFLQANNRDYQSWVGFLNLSYAIK